MHEWGKMPKSELCMNMVVSCPSDVSIGSQVEAFRMRSLVSVQSFWLELRDWQALMS